MLVRISLTTVKDDCTTNKQYKIIGDLVARLRLSDMQKEFIAGGAIITTHVRDLKELF